MSTIGLDKFMAVYEKHLRVSHQERPADYVYPTSEIPVVLHRMRAAIERGSMSKDSPAFKRTCKELGIAHTYKAIAAYIAPEAL